MAKIDWSYNTDKTELIGRVKTKDKFVLSKTDFLNSDEVLNIESDKNIKMVYSKGEVSKTFSGKQLELIKIAQFISDNELMLTKFLDYQK